MEIFVLRRFGDNRPLYDNEGSKWSSLELAQLVALYTQQELDISRGIPPGWRTQLTWLTDGPDLWRAYASRDISTVTGFTIERRLQHDIHALVALLPGWELLGPLRAYPGAPDPEPDRLSYPIAGGMAFEMEQDGTCWFRRWDRTGGLSYEDDCGEISPDEPQDIVIMKLQERMKTAVRERLGI